MKLCPKCKETKPFESFANSSQRKDGKRCYCKACSSEDSKEYAKRNINKIKERTRLYEQKNKESIKKRNAEYYNNNKEKINERIKKYVERKKDDVITYRKQYYLLNRERILAQCKEYSESNKDKVSLKSRNHYLKNIDYIKKRTKNYREENKAELAKRTKELINSSEMRLVKHKMRRAVKEAINRIKFNKQARTEEILGADYETVKLHIESKFTEGMTWSNHGLYGWHIDHITPLATATCEQDIIRLNHYTNLQPLWAKDNLSKGKKIL
jgi:hypothetical protein